MESKEFEVLKGQTLKSVVVREDNERIIFTTKTGEVYEMFHYQCCCESVHIEDVEGDWDDLIGNHILLAEEVSNRQEASTLDDEETWTFYKLSTIKGSVTVRWIGSSNGYYSTDVSFYLTKEGN